MEKKKRDKGTGRIFKVQNKFYLQYTDIDGKRKCTPLKTVKNESISSEDDAEKAAKIFLDKKKNLVEIETREEYLSERAKLKKLKARLTITLDNAFDLHLTKPHPRAASDGVLKVTRRYWQDFVCFVKDNYRLATLDEVDKVHAEAYIAHIRRNGRWNTKISYVKKNCPVRKKFRDYEYGGALSNTTLNRYHSTCKAVFSYLLSDLGYTIEENPFYQIHPLKLNSEGRDIFTDEELRLIFANPPEIIKHLFMIGMFTGLRLSDAATLRWCEIEQFSPLAENPDFLHQEIIRLTLKTKTRVKIPIMHELNEFLKEQYLKTGQGEFIIPEAADLYYHHRNMLNNRIQSYLNSLGIITQKAIPGRKKKQSIKGFHSLRHCFCYYAGIRGVPLPVIKSIVGHFSQSMTEHYQKHADKQARIQGLSRMRGVIEFCASGNTQTYVQLRRQLIEYIGSAPDSVIDQIHALILQVQHEEPDKNRQLAESDDLRLKRTLTYMILSVIISFFTGRLYEKEHEHNNKYIEAAGQERYHQPR